MNEPAPAPHEFDLTIRIMGGQRIVITAPGDMRIEKMISELIEAVNLPRNDPADGRPKVWRLYDKLSRTEIDLTQTVADICTSKKNVELFLTPLAVAG